MNALIYVDGGSRQKGKHAAIGISLCRVTGREVLAVSRYVGPATSNQAEYLSLIGALVLAQALRITAVTVRSDSQLMVNQVTGRCCCASPELHRLYTEVKRRQRAFSKFSLTHVCREDNQRADWLVNRAFAERECRVELTEDSLEI